MKYLVDANVLSEPTKPSPDPKVIGWLRAREGNLIVDPIILGEMYSGILALPRGKKRARLEEWFESVVRGIECLAWEAEVGLRWAKLVVDLRRAGHTMPLLDAMIAATALRHGLAVGTRNVRDFEKTHRKLVNPFA